MEKVIPCEVYSRVVGYYRPVHNWNTGKKQEFHERVPFVTENCDSAEKKEMQAMPLIGGGAEAELDSYKIFTFPNCGKCREVKEFLNSRSILGTSIDLKSPEGNREFRQYYSNKELKEKIKRGDDGTLKLPIVLFMNKGNVVTAAQSLEETREILA